MAGRVIAVYNYKGGVAKTTTVLNISSVAAHVLNKRVLLVDCDPQCNLTSFFFPDPRDPEEGVPEDPEAGNAQDDGVAEAVPDMEVDAHGTALPFIKGDSVKPTAGDGMDIDLIRRGYSTGCTPSIFSLLRPQFFQGRFDISDDQIDGILPRSLSPDIEAEDSTLWLLPGSNKIEDFEARIGLADTLKEVAQILRMGFRRLINRIVRRKAIDLVFIDFGPSASLLNRTFLATCDYILPPSFTDYFNVASLDGLLYSVMPSILDLRHDGLDKQGSALSGLLDLEDKDGRRMTTNVRDEFRFPERPPKLLFTVVTNYKTRRCRATNAYPEGTYIDTNPSKWIETMRRLFERTDIDERVKGLFVPNGRGTDKANMVLALLTTFNQTQQLSHEIGIPVPMLTEGLLETAARQRGSNPTQRMIQQDLKIAVKAKTACVQLVTLLSHPNL